VIWGEVQGREAGGRGVASGASGYVHGEKARPKACGARARAGRTPNMPAMRKTLEVSKLSGWLKTDAVCRVKRRSMRCGARCAP
jgi:hypothetical protein